MYCVYVLQSNKSYYIGYTKNIENRIVQHKKSKPGFVLIYYGVYKDSQSARLRERRLKTYGSAWRGLKQRI